jgi:plasmid stabilization system protein ParE
LKVIWTATAIARLEEIEDYIAADDPAAAVRFVEALLDAGDGPASSPLRGRNVPELPASGLREVVYERYRLVYRVRGRRIEILTVFEGHRLLREDELE